MGDRVITLSGEQRPIKWIGRRSYDGRFVRRNPEALPILIKRHALGDDVPNQDLYVSSRHALYLNSLLIPAALLVNGISIVRCESIEKVEYFHVELASHDVIFANGAPAETYVNCDNRAWFHNATEFFSVYPDDDSPNWTFCAPLVEHGSSITEIRQNLALRLPGFKSEVTSDPDLCLLVGGSVIHAETANNGTYRFTIPQLRDGVHILSLSATPSALGISQDERSLGVAICRLRLRAAGITKEISLEAPELHHGFYQAEPGHRWTNGSAFIPSSLCSLLQGKSVVIEIDAVALPLYPRNAPTVTQKRASAQAKQAS